MKSFARKLYQRVSLFALAFVIAVSSLASAVPFIFAQTANALDQVTVTPTNPGSWTTDDTRTGGAVQFVTDSSSPVGAAGALRLTTNNTSTAKAQYTQYFTPLSLSSLGSDLSYYTKQNAGTAFAGGDPAYQIYVYVNGTSGFDTFTYEPYLQGGAAIQQGNWQQWDVADGLFYSSHDFTGVGGGVQTSQGTYMYTLAQLKSYFPSANVIGIGLNIGSNNPSYNVEADGVVFNGVTYNFEPIIPNIAITPTAGSIISGTKTFTATSDTTMPAYMYVELNHNGNWIAANTGSGSSTSLTYDTTGLADGTYTIKVDAIESNGNSEERLFNYTVDHDAPTNMVVTPINSDGSSIVHGTVHFTVSATDPNYSYSYLEVNKNGNWVTDDTHGTSSYSGSTLSWDWDSTSVADGTYTLKADAVDKAGNTTEQNINFTVDNAIPSVPTNVHFVDGSNTIAAGTVVGPLWNINNYQVQWDTTGEATDAYQTLITYPDGTTSDQWTSTKNLWIGQTAYVNNFFGQKGDGVYSYKVMARSAANGSWSDWSAPISLTYDGTAPVVHITSPSANAIVNGTVAVTGTVTDANPSVAYMTVTRNSNHHQVAVLNDNTGLTNPSLNWNTTNTPDGTYTIHFEAKDLAGNEVAGVSTQDITVTVDNHAPHAPTLLAPANNIYTNDGNVHFTYQAAFGFVNPPLKYTLEVATDAGFTHIVKTYTGTSTSHNFGLADGTYYARASDTDGFGATSSDSTVHTFTVDTTDPSVSITSPANNSRTNTDVVLTGTASDANFQSYIWTVKDSHNVLVASYPDTSSTVTPYTWHLNESTADGTYTITLKAIDKAGNSTTRTVHVTIDRTAPTAAFTFTAPGPSDTSFKVKFSEAVKSSDATNPANYFLTNWPGAGGSGPLTGNATVSYNKFNHTATVTFTAAGWYVSPEQTWGVENIHDLAGNLLSPSPTTAISTGSMVNPTAPGTPTTTSPTNNDDVTWAWTAATDPGGANASGVKDYVYTLTDTDSTVVASGTTTNTTAMTTVPSDGTYTLSVYTEDNAGNHSDAATGHVTVDTVKPVVAIVTPVDGSLTGNIASFTVHATIDDAVTYTILVNGSAVVTDAAAPFVDYDVTTPANTSNVYSIEVEATDLAGNTGSATSSVAVDNTAPVLVVNNYTGTSLTPTISGTTDGATDVVTVNGIAATVDTTANSNNLYNWTYTLPTQSVGTHNLSIVSTDTYGNATTETATVNVQQTPSTVGGNPGTTTTTVTGNGDNTTTDQGVLGASTDTSNTAGVKGDSTTKTTNKTDNNSYAGLAWYWWLLIIAAIAAAAWWIIAAIRRRSAGEQN